MQTARLGPRRALKRQVSPLRSTATTAPSHSRHLTLTASPSHGSHERVTRLNNRLKELGLSTWFDAERMDGDIAQAMTSAIDSTAVVVCCITQNCNASGVRTHALHAGTAA